jgi:predicted ATPase
MLCLARPELLDIRPGWGGGRVRATAIELEPLNEADSEALIEALLADDELSPTARTALFEKTEGNPLFVEETLRMLAEANGAKVDRIPDTLQALIAARIDHLPLGEKSVLQRAAVIGRTFWAGAVEYLGGSGHDGELAPLLDDLLLRELVLTEPRSSISGEDAYRFKHVLIREVAYGGLSKTGVPSPAVRRVAWRSRAGGAPRGPGLPPRSGERTPR